MVDEGVVKKENFSEASAGKKVEKVVPETKEGKEVPKEVKPITGVSKENIYRERIILISFLVIIVLFAVLFYNWESKQPQVHYVSISDFNFRDGVMLVLPGYSEIDFNYADVGYLAKANFLEGGMNFEVGGAERFLGVGDSLAYDLNEDGEDDLFVRFESFREGEMVVYLKEIYEFICPENWDCTEWGPCINGAQKRVCVDLNTCDTELKKPEFVMVC